MASIHDVEAIKVIESAAKEFSKNPDMSKPEWAVFVGSLLVSSVDNSNQKHKRQILFFIIHIGVFLAAYFLAQSF